MKDKITLNAMTKMDLQAVLKKYNPPRKCCKCGRDIPTDDDIGGISCRSNTIMLICNKKECVDYTWKNAMESPDA